MIPLAYDAAQFAPIECHQLTLDVSCLHSRLGCIALHKPGWCPGQCSGFFEIKRKTVEPRPCLFGLSNYKLIFAHLWKKNGLDHWRSRNFLARFVTVARFFPRLRSRRDIPFAAAGVLPALLDDCLSAIAAVDSLTSKSTSSGRGNTDLHMVGKVPCLDLCYPKPLSSGRQKLKVYY